MRARLGDGDGDGDGDGTYHLLCLWLMPQLLAALRVCARGWRRVAGPSVFCMSKINESVGCVRMQVMAKATVMGMATVQPPALPLLNASSPNLARYYRMAFQYIIYIVIKINYSLTFSLHGSILMNLFDACASR
jgi:hypothetical protein